jgi:hypothetical protein
MRAARSVGFVDCGFFVFVCDIVPAPFDGFVFLLPTEHIRNGGVFNPPLPMAVFPYNKGHP